MAAAWRAAFDATSAAIVATYPRPSDQARMDAALEALGEGERGVMTSMRASARMETIASSALGEEETARFTNGVASWSEPSPDSA